MSEGRVLVVDDEPEITAWLRDLLSADGYDVLEARDGEEAIDMMASGDNALMVDTVVTGLIMPRLNGEALIHHLRTEYPSLPIVVFTGQAKLETARRLLHLGVVDYLLKPASPESIIAAVEGAVGRHGLFSSAVAA